MLMTSHATAMQAPAAGHPTPFPDAPAQVRGFKPSMDATAWIASRVTHNLTDAGYTTAVEMELAY